MNRTLAVGIGLLVLGVAAMGIYSSMSDNPATQVAAVSIGTESATTSPDTGANTGSSSTPSVAYTMAEVATHASTASCWIAINGKVYDFTGYAPQHPGGTKSITTECGKDGSASYNRERGHTGSEVAQELAAMYLGDVSS